MNLHGLPNLEQYVDRVEMAARLRISVRSFDYMRAHGRRTGNPCPQQTWALHRVLFKPSRVLAWAETLQDEKQEEAA